MSETFIPAQVESYSRWSPTLVGYQQVDGLEIGHLAPKLLYDRKQPIDRIRLKRDQYLPYLGISGRRITALLKHMQPDLIHAHFGYDGILIADAARAAGIPAVITLHGSDVLRDWREWASGRDGFFFRFYPAKMKRLFADPDVHFVAVSEALRRAAIGQGAPADRIRVVYTGVARGRFEAILRRPATRPTILFVGRLVEFKGAEYLIRAMAQVRAQLPAARLVIAGDGPLRADLQALSTELGVEAEFLGRVTPDRVETLLAEASLLCLPSIVDRHGGFEAFGMVMLEAQAAGVPVVTSAAAGPETILPGITGHVVPEKNAEALAEAIMDIISASPERMLAMSHACRALVVQRFDIRNCTAQLETYYDDIMRAKRNESGEQSQQRVQA